MRSPSTGTVEDHSSALFRPGRLATSSPVGGLRMAQTYGHEPVMVDEVVALLAPVPPGVVVDATVGGGGHAAAILAGHAHLAVLGLDRDPEAVAAASARLAEFGGRAAVRHARFADLAGEVAAARDAGPPEWPVPSPAPTAVSGRSRPLAGPGAPPEPSPELSGVLLDLGVSSAQLDRPERGFSYRLDAPLDMRMDRSTGTTALELVNEASAGQLAALFAASGEGRLALRIARAVVAARPVSTTAELAEVVARAVPAPARRRGHPARRVFQALRIAVNDELGELSTVLPAALDLLVPGGRLVVISYHSGEDRMVKAVLAEAAAGGCNCPPGLPCVCGARPQHALVFRGARKPSAAEVARNRRAEAARLRALERTAGNA